METANGPQATLFGRGALIGAVNLVQNKADTARWSGSGEAAAGDYGMRRGRVAINAPLVENVLGVRLALSYRTQDGYVGNAADGRELNGTETLAGRVAVRFEPTSALRFDLIVNTQQDDTTGTAFKSGTFAPAGGDTSPYTDASLANFGGFLGDRELGLDRTLDGVTLLGDWEISDALTLSSITGARNFNSLEVFDPDGSSLNLLAAAESAKGEQWSQEFRLNWRAGDRLSGFFGAGYFREDGRQNAPLVWDERTVLALLLGNITSPYPQSQAYLTNAAVLRAEMQALLGASGVSLPTSQVDAIVANLRSNHTEEYTNYGETDSIDLYGDLTWAATDKLEFGAGLRWTRDEKTAGYAANTVNGRSVLGGVIGALSLSNTAQRDALLAALALPGAATIAASSSFPSFGLFVQPTANGEKQTADGTFDDFTWRFTARYELAPEVSLWAAYARGRRPEVITTGGPSTPGGVAAFSIVPAEKVDSFEIGAKTRRLGGKLALDGSVYFYEYSDFQTSEVQGTQIVTINAGEAEAYGFEGAVRYAPSPLFSAFANYGYSHARITGGARDGNVFRLSPDHSAAIGATLRAPLPNGASLSFTPTYTWQSEVFFDDDNDRADLQSDRASPFLSDTAVDERQGAYGLLNLRAAYAGAAGDWSLGVFVTNTLDEEYLIDAGNTGDTLGIPTFIRGAPRMVGAEVRAGF